MSENQQSTEGMVDYSRNSAMQQQVVNHHIRRIGNLVERLGQVQPELNIVDYGCGPGQTAIDAVAPAIAAFRGQHPEALISVCHADQPGNDWNSLFARISGPSGYAAHAIRTGAAIGSFYDQMMPDNTVDFGTCFMASHWMSRAVHLPAPGSVWFADLQGEPRTKMADLARRDWLRFLQCRARELRSGGYLMVSCLGSVPQADEINGLAGSGRGVYRAIQIVAKAMADEGIIDATVLDQFVFGVWFMSEQEARQPLESDPGLAEAFGIEEISVVPAPNNPTDVFADFLHDPVEYARLYVGYIRGFGHSSLSDHLFEPSTANGWNTDKIADEFYHRLDELYQTQPGKFAGENWYLTVVLRRT